MKHVFRFVGMSNADGSWQITDSAEIEHARKVLRIKEGDAVEVFDGRGAFGHGLVTSVERDHITVRVEETQKAKAPTVKIRLGIGALKPGDLDEVLPALVELGVDEVLVFHQEGTEKFRLAEKAVARWEKIVLAAAKQCKRPWFTQVRTFDSLDSLLKDDAVQHSERLVLLPQASQSIGAHAVESMDVVAVIGGERGLTESEEKTLNGAGFKGVCLGKGILRASTAVIAAAAILGCRRDDVSTDEV